MAVVEHFFNSRIVSDFWESVETILCNKSGIWFLAAVRRSRINRSPVAREKGLKSAKMDYYLLTTARRIESTLAALGRQHRTINTTDCDQVRIVYRYLPIIYNIL